MSIAGCCLDLGVSQELADHRQPLSDSKTAGGKGVAQIMDTHLLKSSSFTDTSPGLLKIGKTSVYFGARDYERIFFDAGQVSKKLNRSAAKMHCLGACFAVGQTKFGIVEMNVFPA